MKLMYSAVLLSTLAVLTLAQTPIYDTKYDNIDIDKILKNDRVLANYIKCLMDQGPCTPDGRELKKTLPDALEHGCTKCSPKQKELTEKVIWHLMQHKTKDWDRLVKKFDPKGIYQKRYDELVAKQQAKKA